MRLKDTLKFMFTLFCAVTTFQVIFIGVMNLIYDNGFMMSMRDILRLPIISFLSALPMLIFVRSKTKKPLARVKAILLQALHFTLTAGIVFGLLVYFGWVDAANAIFIVVFFLAIYISAYVFQELRDRKLAKQLNERINAFHSAENAAHNDEP
ncbi:MAG: DUF3021 domain-containing protein [Oscillospiraceae bacterium]|nr:DUF3021 domain-containing protein [Oscillospiraceae bacterium]